MNDSFLLNRLKFFKLKLNFDLSLEDYVLFFMGEAKRRKELGLPPREKPVELKLPVLDKENIKNKVRYFLYRNPIIPFIFYGLILGAFGWGLYNFLKVYQLIKL